MGSISDSKSDHSRIAEFILKIQEDVKVLNEFQNNPDKVLTEAGIIDEDTRDAIKSGEVLKIRKLLTIEKDSREY